MAKQRNNIIELGRFVYSLLVVGYHIQLSYDEDNEALDPFDDGALAVEYYFILSGYFLARSLEKLNTDDKTSFFLKYFNFMKNKVKGLLNVHIIAIIAVIIIIACCDSKIFVDKFVPGITSIFLVHMIVVWHGDLEKALIVPEWYLSSMLICMLFMVPIFLAFRKILRGEFVALILLGVLLIFALIFGFTTNWKLRNIMVFNMRAWGEMNLAMFSYYLSLYVGKQKYGKAMNIFLKVVEIIGYCVPVILGIIPSRPKLHTFFMASTALLTFCAIFITFSNKGNIVQSEKVNNAFAYLGSISLSIYIFHPVIIILIDYVYKDCPKYAKYLIVFLSSLILAFAYRIIADILNKKIDERNKKKKEKEKEKIKEKEKKEIKYEDKEELKEGGTSKDSEGKNTQINMKEN